MEANHTGLFRRPFDRMQSVGDAPVRRQIVPAPEFRQPVLVAMQPGHSLRGDVVPCLTVLAMIPDHHRRIVPALKPVGRDALGIDQRLQRAAHDDVKVEVDYSRSSRKSVCVE